MTTKYANNRQGNYIPATLRIGKEGFKESLIDEAKKQLKKKDVIKIKMLKSSLDSSDKAEFLKKFKEAGFKYTKAIGNTIIIYRNKP